MATLQYFKEYRTYEQIAADFGIHESTLIRKSHWIEDTLSKHGFAITTQTPTKDDIAIVDVSEVRVNRPKKTKHSCILARKSVMPQRCNVSSITTRSSYK